MKSLIEIKSLSKADIKNVIDLTSRFKSGADGNQMELQKKQIVTIFFEPSTRTKLSFQLAAKQLGIPIIDISKASSSTEKGESLRDTIKTIESLGSDLVVIRDYRSGVPQYVAKKTNMKVINAGDGMNEHPTQALLDIFTIYQQFGTMSNLTIAIVGDILHSRVAHSNIYLHEKLGNKTILCGPPTLVPSIYSKLFPTVQITHNLDDILSEVDVVMMLRIQTERQADMFFPSFREFSKLYSLTDERIKKLKQNTIVMHPGPVNRDVEITASAMDNKKSVILAQVENGLYLRKAILSMMLK